MRLPGQTAWLLLSFAVIALDQVSKRLVASHMNLYDTLYLLPVFNIALLHNTGAAFSFLAGASGWQRWVFVALALGITCVIAIWLARQPQATGRWQAAALALVAGGALGNAWDRLAHGYVIDFLQVHYAGWYFPAFNAADSAITIGAAMLILDGLFLHRSQSKA
ncbi:MAG TPA: signal peptidase II [Gammaproteobacteria bacterium]|nr:signal peptidase II [Gammaproteobacteria bacterium]